MQYPLRFVMGILFLVCSLGLYSQAGNYSFTFSSQSYTPLGSSATSVSALNADSGEDDVPIGFDFEFEGVLYDTVSATSDGFLSFVPGATSTLSNDLDGTAANRRPLVAPLWDDHDGRASSSSASYEVIGTAPNRVFIFEWRDWEWSYNSTDSVVSFQVELHETSNEIYFNYRWECASCITSPDASIGITGANSFLSVTDIGTGTPTASNASENSAIDSIITDHRYRFVPPACPAPTFAGFSYITTSQIVVNWSGVGSDSVLVNWGPVGFDQATSTMAVTDTSDVDSLQLTGLSSGTAYDFYIRRKCGGNLSPWMGPFTASTLCTTQSLPYVESFDNTLGCFTALDSGTTTDTWHWTADYLGSDLDGNPGFAFANSDAAGLGTTLNEYLVSPVIDASNLQGVLLLEFDQYYNHLGSNADVEVYDGTQWVTVLAQTTDAGDWSNPDQQSIDLTQYANANLQVRFHYYNANYAWYWAVDNFSLRDVVCNSSSNLSSVLTASDSITINWNAGGGVNFGIEYGPAGFSPGSGTLASAQDTFFTANGLSANTGYDFYVIDSCQSSNSQPLGPLTVFTTCTAVQMPYTESFDTWPLACWDSSASVDFFWVPFAGTGGNQFARANFWGNSTGTSVLKSRPITIGQDAQVRLYWSHSYSTSYPDDKFVVRAKVQGNTTWDTILNLQGSSFDDPGAGNTSPGSFTEEVLVLDPAVYTGNNVVFELQGVTDWGPDLFIDDFNVEPLPPCPDPQALADSGTSAFETTLIWDDVTGNANSFEVWLGPVGFYQGTNTTGGAKQVVNFDSLFVDTLSKMTCYEFLVRGICGNGDSSAWVGPISFCTPPTCPAPVNLGFLSATTTTADVHWTAGGATDFNLEVGPTGFSQGAGTLQNFSNDTATVTGLSAGTTYDYYVRDSCGQGDVSVWTGPFTFTTAYNTNFLDDYDNSAFANEGWAEADGQLTTNSSLSGTSSWGFQDFANDGSATSSQSVNIYTDTQYEWLISPSIYLDPSITNLQVEFDAAITEWIDVVQGYLGSDDTLALVISTDNGLTWSSNDILWLATANDTVDSAGEHYVVPLNTYSGYVRFGFYAGSTIDDSEDNDLFIDNFEVRTPRACTNPTNLLVNGISTTRATVRWTPADPNALGWEVIITSPGQNPANGIIYNSSAIDSLALIGLNSSSQYCFYVVEQCANGYSDTVGPECFSTLCNPFTAPYSQNFDGAAAQDPFGGIPCWTTIGPGAEDIELNDSPDAGIDPAPSAPNTVELNDGSYPSDTAILVSPAFSDLNSGLNRIEFKAAFENTSEELFIGLLDNPSDASSLRIVDTITTTMVDTFITYTYDFNDPALVGNAQNIAFVHGTDIYEVYIDDFIYEPINVTCPQPSGLSATAVNCDTIEVSWTSNTGGSIIQYGPAGFTSGTGTYTNIVTSPATITGLALDSDYDVWVADTCGNDTSAFAGPFTVATDSLGPLLASFTNTVTAVTMNNASVSFDASASSNAVSYSWDFDNGSNGTGVNTITTYTSNGTYNVELTVTDRCGNSDDTTVAIVVEGISLNENAIAQSLELYPNPNRGEFVVKLPNVSSNFSIIISDMSGKSIYQEAGLAPNVENRISVDGLAKGVYTVKVNGTSFQATRRIVVE